MGEFQNSVQNKTAAIIGLMQGKNRALGTLPQGAAALSIDTATTKTRLQGDHEAFDLHSRGLTGVLLVALGYGNSEDFNTKLPKARLPAAQVMTEV